MSLEHEPAWEPLHISVKWLSCELDRLHAFKAHGILVSLNSRRGSNKEADEGSDWIEMGQVNMVVDDEIPYSLSILGWILTLVGLS